MTTKYGYLLVLAGISVAALACGASPPPAPATPDVSAPTSPTSAAAGATGDSDSDGVLDSADKCPDKKEDGQAPNPTDGCPKS